MSAATTPSGPQPNAELVFQLVSGYQTSGVMRAAIDLHVFTRIAEGASTLDALAQRSGASVRGVRALCNYLVLLGLLSKDGDNFALTPTSDTFLNEHSPAYFGGMVEFLQGPELMAAFSKATEAVRKGGTALDGEGSMEPDHPMWVNFARAMRPLAELSAGGMAEIAEQERWNPKRVLDVAAGHGAFGIAFARRFPECQVTALDWANVLAVARENAAELGTRFSTIEGNAFTADLGGPYDAILLTNFLHHFDPETNTSLIRRLAGALGEGGRIMTLEFVTNDDRVTPPSAASFAMVMLTTTKAGDAYTFREYDQMFRDAGLSRNRLMTLPRSPQQLIVSER